MLTIVKAKPVDMAILYLEAYIRKLEQLSKSKKEPAEELSDAEQKELINATIVYGVRYNLMTCRYGTDSDNNFYRMQSNLVGQLVEFAKRYDIHVHLVAHPRKSNGGLDNDDVAGSGDITNRADNVFSLERLSESDKKSHNCDTMLKILKNRVEGASGKIGLNYDPISRRLYMPSKGNTRVYGWEKPADEQDFYEIDGGGWERDD
jgi:hypothetical protein